MTLPNGWTKAKLGDITLGRVEQGEPGSSPVSYIDIGSIDRDLKRVGQTQLVTGVNAPTRARQWVKSGDVLVSLTRPNLNAVALVTPELDGAVASTGFDVLRPQGILPEWVFNRVRSHAFVADVCEGVQGVVYPAIRPADVRRHDLPVPPVQEQRRIVDAIDSHLTRLDDAVASLERVHEMLRTYRASVLKVAVEGRLVPTEAAIARREKRAYEPADALLARILTERRSRWEEAELANLNAAGKTPRGDKWKAKYKEPVSPDTRSLPELPEGWCWASVDQLTTHITSGSRGWAKYYSNDGATFVRAQDIKTDALVFDKIAHVSPPRGAEGTRTSVSQFDLLITITGANVTKAALVERSLGEAYVSQHVGLCRPVLTQLAPYLHLFIVCPSGGRRVLERAAYGAGKPGLNLDNLKELAVPIPPAKEAARAVEQCAELLSVAENVAATVTHDLNRVSQLRQSVLKWAFEGKLVDQDRTDEPADELLSRIRAERTAGSPTERTPRGQKRETA
jgi:type I restriction enzyme S subunit